MKVGIIGAGNVGSASAYALIMRGIARKIVLVDLNEKRARAEAEDILHATPFAYANKIKAGNYENLNGCDVVVITAGANQKPGETRLDLLEKNTKIFKSIIPEILKNAPDAILVVASNPVDVMTRVTMEISGLPKERVFGTGTVLDTARFRSLLGYHLGVSAKSVHAHVLGEHGDSEVLAWSPANAGTIQIEELAKDLGRPITEKIKAEIEDGVVNAAYSIIEGKGSTYYGIGGAIARICQAVSSNEYAVLTVSTIHGNVEGVNNVCLSLPCIIGKRGIHQILEPRLNKEEKEKLKSSAIVLKEAADQALSFL